MYNFLSFAHSSATVFSLATSLIIESPKLKMMVLLAFLSISVVCSGVFYDETSFLFFLVTSLIASPNPSVINKASIFTFHILKSFFLLKFSRSIFVVAILGSNFQDGALIPIVAIGVLKNPSNPKLQPKFFELNQTRCLRE